MANSDWRYYTRLFYVAGASSTFQVRDIQDALKW